ncbi:MAG: KH domain-containing protein [Pleurocapsa sp.]
MSANSTANNPDYVQLVRFLIEPLLEDERSLYINSEVIKDKKKVWLRVAFENSDRGKVFGRGGRNIQAIRTILNTAAATNKESIFLDIYSDEKESSSNRDRRPGGGNFGKKKNTPKSPPRISRKS